MMSSSRKIYCNMDAIVTLKLFESFNHFCCLIFEHNRIYWKSFDEFFARYIFAIENDSIDANDFPPDLKGWNLLFSARFTCFLRLVRWQNPIRMISNRAFLYANGRLKNFTCSRRCRSSESGLWGYVDWSNNEVLLRGTLHGLG